MSEPLQNQAKEMFKAFHSQSSPSGYSWFGDVIDSHTESGSVVTPSKSLQHTAVFTCNRVLAESIASLPLVLFKEDDKGKREKAKDHPVYDLIHASPNGEHTSMTWREMMVTSLNMRGGHYSQLVRDGRGKILEIWPMQTDRTRPHRSSDGVLWFIYRDNNGKDRLLRFEDVLNVIGLTLDGVTPISPILYNKESIGLSQSVEGFGARYFKNGATASGALSYPHSIDDEGFERLKKDFETSYQGMMNSHKPIILEGGAKFEKLSMSNEESQFLETRKFQKEEIAGIYRIPPHMINILDRATFKNIEQMSLDFAIYTLSPWLVRIEQAMERDLLTKQERKDGYFIRHNLNGLLRGDSKARAELYKTYVQNGIFTINDALKLEDMNPVEDGDKRFFPMNMTTVEHIIKGSNLKQEVKSESDK